MYRKYLCILLICILIMPQAMANDTVSMVDIFVSNGAEDGDGNFEKPFGNIKQAIDYVRQLKADGIYPEKGVNVNFRGGTYYIANAITFDENDSGTQQGPVTYQAYGNEEVTFTGGVSIPISEFSSPSQPDELKRIRPEVADKVKAYDLHKKGITEYGQLNPYGWGVNNYYNSEGNKPADEIAEWMGFQPSITEPIISIGSEKMTLARYPNEPNMASIAEAVDQGLQYNDWAWTVETWEYDKYGTYTTPDKKPKMAWEDVYGFTIKGDDDFCKRMEDWKGEKDVWAYGYWAYNWADLAGKIKSFDFEKKTFTMKHPYITKYDARAGQRFYFYNLLEELDFEGEYYLDRDTGILYIYPSKNASGNVTLSLLGDSIFKLNGCNNIEFRKLSIESGRKHGLEINDSSDVLVELCNIGMLGKNGVMLDGDCRRFKCYSNYFYKTDTGIITSGGDKMTLTHSGNIIENNWFEGNKVACRLYGEGDIMRNNRVNDSDTNAFGVNASEILVEYNEFYDLGRRLSDMGIGYAYRRHNARGTIIRQNYFHDIKSDEKNSAHTLMGFYGDEGFSGVTAESNLFVNFSGRGFMLNGGRDWVIKNNIAVNTLEFAKITGFMADLDAKGWEETYYMDFDQYENLDVYKKFPHFEGLRNDEPMRPKYNVIKDNVIINTPDFSYQAFSALPEAWVRENNDLSESLKIKNDPGFEEMAAGNYILKENSLIYESIPDFKAPDFKNMGLYTPWLAYYMRGNLAMAIDSNIAYKEFKPIYVDEANRKVSPQIINDKTYVPIRFIAENLGGEAQYDTKSDIAGISLGGEELSINITTGEISLNGAVLNELSAIVENGRTLVPVRAVEQLNKTVTWFDEGIIIVGDNESGIKEDNKNLINELLRRMR